MLEVVGALLRVSLMTTLQYRVSFLFDIGTAALTNAARVAPLLLVYVHRDEVAGWDVAHATLVMAFFLLLAGIQGAFLEPNLGEAVEHVRQGTLDLVLMKPADAQLLVSVRKIDPSSLWELVAAVIVGGWALARVDPPSLADAAVALGLFACGVAALYGLWLLAICTSFFFVRVDNLRFILWSAADAGRWPVTVFSGWVRIVLTVVVPVALVTSFPVIALRGLWTAGTVAIAIGTAAAFLLGSRWAWTRSLAAYTSASS